MKLVIVESPTKAKTISRFLGKEYKVESSFGHIRDLPKSKMGIDIEHNFEPKYLVPRDKSKKVKVLKDLAKKADEIYFATDSDREGEAIAWHLVELLKPKKEQAKRITFHEITKHAIEQALKEPRELDMDRVDAQQARRILDRLVGYELSPFLWRKVAKGLSAGRVQSVAVRLIVEREREIEKFNPEEYWSLLALLLSEKDSEKPLEASLVEKDGKKYEKLGIKTKKTMDEILKDLKDATYTVESIEKKEKKRNPYPPFTTSTLQQAANNRLGFSAAQTMRLAQQLYEGVELGEKGSIGLITYMRTDSLTLSGKFIKEARDFISKEFGEKYLPEKEKVYKTTTKGAQEAHEAIRPTDPELTPDDVRSHLDPQQAKLYTLIWQRAVSGQMNPAILDQTTVSIAADKYTFRASGSIVKFDGFMQVYPLKTEEKIFPEIKEKEELDLKELTPTQHFTEPPPRYTEASLVKELEKKGIGRPSTYAPTIKTVIDRNYVEKEAKKLSPTDIGIMVNDVLVEHFPNVVDYDFTAKMEENLDEIAESKKEWVPVVKEFYDPFKKNLDVKEKEVQKSDIAEEETDEKCEKCSEPMLIKMGRYGKFLACSGYPDCKNARPLDKDGEPTAPTNPVYSDEACEECKDKMELKKGRFGAYYKCVGEDCKHTKSVEVATGITCPKCGKGDIIERRSKRGKTFYACNKYPDCKNAYWSKPTGEECSDCKSLLVAGAKGAIVCSNKECKKEKE